MGFKISFSVFLALASVLATCSLITSTSHQDSLFPVQGQQHPECCFHHHFSALLRLKRGFLFTYGYSVTNLSSWNPENRDCCTWEGITCDSSTGHVIALDLGELGISGQMDFQTLSHLGGSLHILNLAYNGFDPSPIPPAVGQLHQLTHLNLSGDLFYGQVPLEMSSLTRLVSLDLSYNDYIPLMLEKPSFGALIQNMSGLRELTLDGVSMSSGREWSRTISSSLPNLRKLSMDGCGLSGPVHPSFSHLPFLSQLDLGGNNLLCAELDFIGNLSSLTSLGLADCHGRFSGKISSLHYLSELDLSRNDISSAVLDFIANSSSLTSLNLMGCGLDGRHLVRILRLPCLTKLQLAFNDFSSVKPDFSGNVSSFKSLTELRLTNCNMSGLLPSHLANFTRLEVLDLSSNAFSGSIPSSYGTDLLNLRNIILSGNLLNGTIPSSLFSLPSLMTLALEGNQLSGQLDEFHNASSSPLDLIILNDNMLQGMIPRSIFRLTNLGRLYLYSNNFSDTLSLDLFLNLTKLYDLALSNINLLVKDGTSESTSMSLPQLSFLILRYCNIKRFPNFLRNQERLVYLDLSSNKMEGEIPLWIWKLGNGTLEHLNLSHNALQVMQTPTPDLSSSRLSILDLSSNVLQGLLPIPSSSLRFYSVSNNSLTGEIPVSMCNLTSLSVLDLSNNNFSGPIPQCFSKMSNVLTVLDLRGNAFNGRLFQIVKQEYCSLTLLDLSDNQLEGELPSSLANCQGLVVINLGNNHICGTFPSWIQRLAKLRILILRSNYFYGPIELHPATHDSFSMLQIIDLSFNRFNGSLPSTVFLGWKGMIREGNSELEYLEGGTYPRVVIVDDGAYYESIIVTSKSLEMHFQKIPTVFTLVDLSSNYFQGRIPESIGILKSLQVLNMSHNGFTGQIPTSMKNLTALESLDLSQNSISGYIPQELSEITFLAVLNLSMNQLIGPIPHAKQFLTFTNESYEGNPGLCGPPLRKACGETDGALEDPKFESESEYDWKIIAVGFGIGYGVGMGVFYWTLVLCGKGRRAYNKFVYKVLLLILPSAA